MKLEVKSLRPFIGCKDFTVSREFYAKIGFTEKVISHNMSVFEMEGYAFYLQDAFVKDWVDNTMLFLEVSNANTYLDYLNSINLKDLYPTTKISKMVFTDWGREFFLHDPSGILWHIGNFDTTS